MNTPPASATLSRAADARRSGSSERPSISSPAPRRRGRRRSPPSGFGASRVLRSIASPGRRSGAQRTASVWRSDQTRPRPPRSSDHGPRCRIVTALLLETRNFRRGVPPAERLSEARAPRRGSRGRSTTGRSRSRCRGRPAAARAPARSGVGAVRARIGRRSPRICTVTSGSASRLRNQSGCCGRPACEATTTTPVAVAQVDERGRAQLAGTPTAVLDQADRHRVLPAGADAPGATDRGRG